MLYLVFLDTEFWYFWWCIWCFSWCILCLLWSGKLHTPFHHLHCVWRLWDVLFLLLLIVDKLLLDLLPASFGALTSKTRPSKCFNQEDEQESWSWQHGEKLNQNKYIVSFTQKRTKWTYFLIETILYLSDNPLSNNGNLGEQEVEVVDSWDLEARRPNLLPYPASRAPSQVKPN